MLFHIFKINIYKNHFKINNYLLIIIYYIFLLLYFMEFKIHFNNGKQIIIIFLYEMVSINHNFFMLYNYVNFKLILLHHFYLNFLKNFFKYKIYFLIYSKCYKIIFKILLGFSNILETTKKYSLSLSFIKSNSET